MNALENNRYTDAWRAFGASVPKPRAVLVISAHWFVNVTAVTAMARPRTIHDFYGFPSKLFEVEYPAPGDPAVAELIADVVRPTHAGLDRDSWGIDHGAWSVLVHAFPEADIPVLQLAIDETQGALFHFELGARLAPLREQNILIIASGNVVHNLRAIDWGRQHQAFDWAQRFNDAAQSALTGDPSAVLDLASHEDYARAVPTPDHFYPLLYLAGLAAAANRTLEVMVDGYAYGSLSMASYTLDGELLGGARPDRRPGDDSASGQALPDPAVIPPEETNL